MASVALKVVESRRALATELMRLHTRYGVRIEQLKDKLRDIAEADGAGFKERFDDGTSIDVSKGSEGGKSKGLMPILDAGAYLELSESERKKIKCVTLEPQVTKASRPSVSIKLVKG
jgi:hypothetical protein